MKKIIITLILCSTIELVFGQEFSIATGSDTTFAMSTSFDGTNYLVAIKIDTNGNLQNTITICDSSLHPFLPMVSYGSNNYLVTWLQQTNGSLMGQWYNATGLPNGSPFVVFNTLNNKFPLGATIYANNTFLAIATRFENNFTNGDVYGKFISLTTGVSDIQFQNKILLYPNPASEIISLEIDSSINADLKLYIYNVIGNLVKSEILKQNNQQINIGDLSNGVYMVVIKSKSMIENQRLIIQR